MLSSGASPQRARFYSSLIDANVFEQNKDFRALPETYVIFINENDVLKGGKQIYHIERTIRENGTAFGDGSHIIYVNGKKREGSTPLDLLLQDFFNKNPRQMQNAVLAERTLEIKTKEMKKAMAVPTFDEVYEDGRLDGIDEGKAIATTEVMLANLRRLITKLNMSVEEAMEFSEIPQDQRKHFAELLKN